jgi:hypothetical protein
LSENNARVRNAELRLMLQRSFIERLEAAHRDTTSAEESLRSCATYWATFTMSEPLCADT